ncbi:MAG TPA: energy transducer TonB [Pyrinomonadaceae bacterium]
MKTSLFTLIFVAICFGSPGLQAVTEHQQPQAFSNNDLVVALYAPATYSPELTQRVLEQKSPTWLLTRVYFTDDSIRDVNKYFRAQAQKQAIDSPDEMVKRLRQDNWEVGKRDLLYAPSIFGQGEAQSLVSPSAQVEFSFGIIPLADSVVRIHLMSPYPLTAYNNRLVEGTMIIMIRERLTHEYALDDEKAYSGREVTSKVRVKSKPHPEYAMSGAGGTVVLRVVFMASGKVSQIRVVSDVPGFTDAAVKAARKIKFEPAIKDGRYVSQYIQLEYNFSP